MCLTQGFDEKDRDFLWNDLFTNFTDKISDIISELPLTQYEKRKSIFI